MCYAHLLTHWCRADTDFAQHWFWHPHSDSGLCPPGWSRGGAPAGALLSPLLSSWSYADVLEIPRLSNYLENMKQLGFFSSPFEHLIHTVGIFTYSPNARTRVACICVIESLMWNVTICDNVSSADLWILMLLKLHVDCILLPYVLQVISKCTPKSWPVGWLMAVANTV